MLDQFEKNKNPFKVPDNYFAELTKDVMNNLPVQEVEQVKKVQLWKKGLPWTAAAAVLIGVVLSTGVFNNMPVLLAKTGDKVESERKLAYKNSEDFFLFLEEETTEAMYMDVLMDDE